MLTDSASYSHRTVHRLSAPQAKLSEREALDEFCQVFQREREFSKSLCRDLFSQVTMVMVNVGQTSLV